MKKEIEAVVLFICRLINIGGKVHEEMVMTFKIHLTKNLELKFKNHWYVNKPQKGQGYRCLRINTSDPKEPSIYKAAITSKIKYEELCLPVELTIWIDPEDVTCRFGEHTGSFCNIATFKNGTEKNYIDNIDLENLQNNLNESHDEEEYFDFDQTKPGIHHLSILQNGNDQTKLLVGSTMIVNRHNENLQAQTKNGLTVMDNIYSGDYQVEYINGSTVMSTPHNTNHHIELMNGTPLKINADIRNGQIESSNTSPVMIDPHNIDQQTEPSNGSPVVVNPHNGRQSPSLDRLINMQCNMNSMPYSNLGGFETVANSFTSSTPLKIGYLQQTASQINNYCSSPTLLYPSKSPDYSTDWIPNYPTINQSCSFIPMSNRTTVPGTNDFMNFNQFVPRFISNLKYVRDRLAPMAVC